MKYSKRHLFGQHFISDARLLRRIVELAQLNDNTSVMEIGAGRGNLTKYIAQKAGRVLAVELDKELYAQAAIALRSYKNVKLIQGNILDMNDAGVDVIITSLPYSISARFIEWLSGQGCIRAIAILQEDFANKLVQEVCAKKYGPTSVLGQFCFNLTLEDVIPRRLFKPMPLVDSRLVRFERKLSLINWKNVSSILKFLFSFRGKTIKSTLSKISTTYSEFVIPEINDNKRRIECLTPEEFMYLISYMQLKRNVFTQS
jgi:16S rRNA (adenine1518-N6/adenine1519-N6)-dimethyltransferase